MGGIDRATLRAAALHLDRHRARIELEVNRRLGRASPPPDAREELIRRLRSYARLASVDWNTARPSFDGFAGYSARALERTAQTTVETAGEFSDEPAIREALREIGERFRSGIRRVFIPKDDDGSKKKRKKRANAGKRVRAAIDRISAAYIALCLETGTVYDLNPAAETLFGGDSKALLKRPLQKLVRPEDRVQYQDLESRLDAGEDSAPIALKLQRLDGEAVPVELSVASHTISGRRLAIFSARERTESSLPDYSTRTTSFDGIRSTSTLSARST